jgi:L-fuculose-phosphate aldolase
MNFQLLHPRDQLVAIMNRIYHSGMTTLSGGNLSILDDDGDIWITPAGVDKGNLTPQDIMCVDANGRITGPHRPSSELPFHRAIYAARPDLRAIVHAHPPALVSFSIARQVPETAVISQVCRVCGPVGYAPYALTGSEQLGQVIATTFGEGYNSVMLENHGAVTGCDTLLGAFERLETLEFGARTLLRAHTVGQVNLVTPAELALFDRPAPVLAEFTPAVHSSQERELRQQISAATRRAVARQLMLSTAGVISARVDAHSFLITPTSQDRGALTGEDVVLVRQGQRERGKMPSRAVGLHQAIYDAQPGINCIIMAQPPNVMAYAITGTPFDSRTIPESYIWLRRMPLLPYETLYTQPQHIATTLSLNTPVILVKNDCVIVAAQNILQAFDRLEVAEYSARSLIDTAVIGPLVPIGDDELRELEVVFNLAS